MSSVKNFYKKIKNIFGNKVFFCLFTAVLVFFFITSLKKWEKTSLEIKLLDSVEQALFNLRFFYKEENKDKFISKDTLIVGIDDESLTKIGKWPWYREVHGDFVNKLQQFNPIALHIDVIFNLSEKVPLKVKSNLAEDKKTLEVVEEAFKDLDDAFARSLSNYHNVYIDQFLQTEKILNFDEKLEKKFRYNESVLKANAVSGKAFVEETGFDINPDSVYSYTEPIVEEFVANAIPSVVNAIPDSDSVLRKAALLFPYLDSQTNLYFLSSIYLNMLKLYYGISKEDIKLHEGRMELMNAIAPVLDPVTKDKVEEEVSMEEMMTKIGDKSIQTQYDENLYSFVVNLFRVRYSKDDFKIPEFPISVYVDDDNQWSIFRGKEIYDAARVLKSKRVKVNFHYKRTIVIPMVENVKNNPFTFLVNYATRDKNLAVVDKGDGGVKLEEVFHIPFESYNSVYEPPLFPKLPTTDANGYIVGEYDQAGFETWFKSFVRSQLDKIQENVYFAYGEVNNGTMFQYAIQDNPFEGAFIFWDVYLNQLGGPLDKEVYYNFITGFFEQNGLPLEHTLVTDFVLEPEVALEYLIDAYEENYGKFYNKVVFMGPATTGMARDVHKTPFGDMFGIYTIVNAFNTVIKENFLINSSEWENIIILFLLCLILSGVYISVGNYLKYSFFGISVFVILIVSIYLFAEKNYVLYTSSLIFANTNIFIVMTLYSLLGEERNKKFLKSTFSTYLSPEVIDDMYNKKEMPTLGGEEKYITAYFTDIQSFSSFSEILTAEQLVELLNEYLGAMTDILLDNKGTLDKYEGDAIIAFFGAPLDLPDAAYRAVYTAVKMQEKLLKLREKWVSEVGEEYRGRNHKNTSEEKWPSTYKWPLLVHDMKMRIGVNSGDIVVGNMGSIKRQNYTMMGDDVNLAARLEEAAKQYGIFTAVSGKTLSSDCLDGKTQYLVKDRFEMRLVDKIIVVGKSEPTEIYEILGVKDEISEEMMKLKDLYNQALQFYFEKKWAKAIAAFEKSEKLETYLYNAKTNPSREFIKKCINYKKSPPVPKGQKWNGVTILTSK